MKFMLLKLICTLISVSMISVEGLYRHKIEPFSFDISKFEYPLEYSKVGTAVALRKSIKLIPKVENRYGGIWLIPVSSKEFFILFMNTASRNKYVRVKL